MAPSVFFFPPSCYPKVQMCANICKLCVYAVWTNDFYAQDWNFPKSRALRGFLFFDLFLFLDGRVVDGNRVELPHQMYGFVFVFFFLDACICVHIQMFEASILF